MREETSNEDTKSLIVLGAFQALKSNGLPHISYDMIAEASGVSRQVVRYHFESPDSLMVALCDHLASTYRDALLANAMELEGQERIGMFLDFYFDVIDGTRKPHDDQVYDALMSLSARSTVIRDNLRGQYTLLGQVLTHEFQLAYPALDGRAAGELSFVFVALMYGHWKMVSSLGVSSRHNRISRDAMTRLIHSYVSKPADNVADFKTWSTET